MIPVIHLDDDMVVVAKPPGLVVHQDAKYREHGPVVLQTVAYQLGKHLYPVHRLDRNTSGVLAFALSSEMARALHENLRADDSVKSYLVLCRGETPEQFDCDRPLKNERKEPQPALTEFRRIAHFFRLSLLEARIRTGRRHQIRRHLAHLAHQVIGDSSHGKGRINAFFREEFGLPRMFIHARRLEVRHPRTDQHMIFEQPLAGDLRAFLERLPGVPEQVWEGEAMERRSDEATKGGRSDGGT